MPFAFRAHGVSYSTTLSKYPLGRVRESIVDKSYEGRVKSVFATMRDVHETRGWNGSM